MIKALQTASTDLPSIPTIPSIPSMTLPEMPSVPKMGSMIPKGLPSRDDVPKQSGGASAGPGPVIAGALTAVVLAGGLKGFYDMISSR
jgi:hypothetical protein